jgi:hypothetical protein
MTTWLFYDRVVFALPFIDAALHIIDFRKFQLFHNFHHCCAAAAGAAIYKVSLVLVKSFQRLFEIVGIIVYVDGIFYVPRVIF